MSMPRVCTYCSAIVPDGHYYCGRCGSRFDETGKGGSNTLFYGPMQAPGRAKLILICGEAIEGMSYHLNATHHQCGRSAGVIPFEDNYISTNHTDFFYSENELYVRDEGSVNGTFVKIREPHALEHGDVIRAGDHFFRFEKMNVPASVEADDGTAFYSSPAPTSEFRLVELVDGGLSGRAYTSPNNEIAVGRDGCDLTYAGDPHLSQRHFKVSLGSVGPMVTDLDSRNGTFIRIKEPMRLHHADYVFIGQQLLRVEIAV